MSLLLPHNRPSSGRCTSASRRCSGGEIEILAAAAAAVHPDFCSLGLAVGLGGLCRWCRMWGRLVAVSSRAVWCTDDWEGRTPRRRRRERGERGWWVWSLRLLLMGWGGGWEGWCGMLGECRVDGGKPDGGEMSGRDRGLQTGRAADGGECW